MLMLEIPIEIAAPLVYAIPLVTILLVVLLNILRGRVKNPRLVWFIEKMITSPSTEKRNESESTDTVPSEEKHVSIQKILSILSFAYLALFLFLIGNMLGVYYSVMGDVLEAVNQGATGDTRLVMGIEFLDPFNAGWTGSLPWYGNYPLPLAGTNVYHDTWGWIYFTGLLWGNSAFFNNMLNEVIVFTFIMGLVFLLPLLIPPIRRSFIPSLFLFISGMYVASTSILRCLAQVLKLGYLGGTIQFGYYEQSIVGVDPTAVPIIVGALTPFVLLFAAVFPLLGYKLWRGFYPDNRRSAVWFALYILGSYCLTFLIALW